MEDEQQVRCPLCDGTYEVGAAYTAHLRDAHDLVDDEVPEADDGPGAGSGALDLGVLAAAAASLAEADESLPVPPAPAPQGQPTPVAPRSPARRRGLAVVLAAAVLAVAVWLAGSSDDPATRGRRQRAGRPRRRWHRPRQRPGRGRRDLRGAIHGTRHRTGPA